MPVQSKVFSYEVEGLSYTVTVYEDGGAFYADIAVTEGAMDVNAIYFGDDDFSGESEMLSGPLNMNGARLYGEDIQWDSATALSDPGLGPEGTDKETYVEAGGQPLTLQLDIDSLDEIDVFGIRATSTTTDSGSIKAVSDEPEDPEDPEDPTFDKVGFALEVNDETGGIENGIFLFEEVLPEGQDGTFENYVNYLETETEYSVPELQAVIFYEVSEEPDGSGGVLEIPRELFRIDAPEGGFENAEELLAAYDAAIASGVLEDMDEGSSLMAALSLDPEFEESGFEEDPMADEELEFA